jgi:replicative DNA helicase
VSQVVAQITKGTAAPPPREPPHSIEAEQSLLGAFLVNTEAYDGVDGLVSADDFFDPVHARMFEVIAAAREAGQQMTPKLMTGRVQRRDRDDTGHDDRRGDRLST